MILIAKTYISLIIPILILFLFVFFAFILPFSLKKIKQQKENKRIKKLKNGDHKILVKLSECEVLTNSILNEKMRYGNSPVLKILEHKFTEEVLQSKIRDIDISIVYFEGIYKGDKKIFYSKEVQVNHQSFPFLFEKYKQTYIYIDDKNPDNYYFDLEFLENSI